MPDGDSPFLAVPASKWLAANDSAFVIADRFPVSPGHALVIPRRVIGTWWEATAAERADILALIDEVKDRLDAELGPDGYNVGFNSGAAAGQTVGHLHIHVIPRYRGDVPDPRGGVRHVLPGRGNYLLPERDQRSATRNRCATADAAGIGRQGRVWDRTDRLPGANRA
jgi:diadenosine tetraphosphate (Ap4A) HIT family hydrolase